MRSSGHSMQRCSCLPHYPFVLKALVVLLATTPASGLKQTIRLYRKSASLDSNPQRRLDNVLYYGSIQLGMPGQALTVCPDTGSAAVWTAADTTPPAANGNSDFSASYNGFVGNASSSFQVVGYNFSEKYSTGGVIGVLASDRVQLGDITIGNASLGLVTEASVDLMGASCAGVLGLGRPGLTRPGRAIFYRMLAEQGLLDAPTFSLWLSADPEAKPAGSLTFGGTDSALYFGTLIPLPVISSKYWMVGLSGLQAGGASLPISARGAILDSSSALNLLTDRDFLALEAFPGVKYSSSTGAFQVLGGCTNITSLPNITISLGSYNFTLTPQQYVVQIASTACVLGIQPGAPDNTVVLGTAFLRAYYTTYTYNATSKSSYVSIAPAAPGNSTTGKRRRVQELGGYPGAASGVLGGTPPASTSLPTDLSSASGSLGLPAALPPSPATALSVAADASGRLGNAADQAALLAAALAVQASFKAPAPAPVPSVTPAAAAAGAAVVAQAPEQLPTAAPLPYPPAALLPTALPFTATTPAPVPMAATQAASPAQVPAPSLTLVAAASPPSQPPSQASPSPAPAAQAATSVAAPQAGIPAAPVQAPQPAPVTEGITDFPARVQSAPVQAPAPVPTPPPGSVLTAASGPQVQIQVTLLTRSPAAAPPAQALPAWAAVPSSPAQPPAAAAPLPSGVSVPVYPLQALVAPAPGAAPPARAPAKVPARAPAPASGQRTVAGALAPRLAPKATPTAAPQLQPALVSIAVLQLNPAPIAAPAPAPAKGKAAGSYSLRAPAPAPAALQPARISIPVTPLAAAPKSAPTPYPAAVARIGAPAPAQAKASAPAPAASKPLQPARISIPVTLLVGPPVTAPTSGPASAAGVAAAGAPAPTKGKAVSAYSLHAPAPAPAASKAGGPARTPAPKAIKAATPIGTTARAPSAAAAPAKQPAKISIRVTDLIPGPAPARSAAMGAAPAPSLMAPGMAPAPGPLAAAGPMGSRGPFGTLFPTGKGNASTADAAPPFQAVPGLEVLYGGLRSLWRLPLQLSDADDALFARYLAAHPLTARQNRTLTKPKPPTLAGFGQPVNLVVLDSYLDTCVVGWSSVNSCRAKGLNDTTCALMPIFDDVDTLKYQCPYKNETQVQLPRNSGNYVPISQQWLLVRPGTRGQQIFNVGLGKCLDICTEQAPASLCGHAGNVYLKDCDSTSATQQWLLKPTAMVNATLSNANTANLTAYQISSAYVPPVANRVFEEAPVTQTCMDTCEAERDAEILPSAYGQTTCNGLLPTYPSSAAVFPCNPQHLPHSISQAFAIVFALQPSSA